MYSIALHFPFNGTKIHRQNMFQHDNASVSTVKTWFVKTLKYCLKYSVSFLQHGANLFI